MKLPLPDKNNIIDLLPSDLSAANKKTKTNFGSFLCSMTLPWIILSVPESTRQIPGGIHASGRNWSARFARPTFLIWPAGQVHLFPIWTRRMNIPALIYPMKCLKKQQSVPKKRIFELSSDSCQCRGASIFRRQFWFGGDGHGPAYHSRLARRNCGRHPKSWSSGCFNGCVTRAGDW